MDVACKYHTPTYDDACEDCGPLTPAEMLAEVLRLRALEERAGAVSALGMPRAHARPTDEPGAQVRTAYYILTGTSQ